MRIPFVRALLIAMAVFVAVFALEFYLEWRRLGMPSDGMSWAGVNNAKLVDILSPMARAYNNVLAMLIATIGLAIPLTANMHTPKLIDMFLRDRINRFVLSFMALGAAHVLWVDYIIGPEFAPTWAINAAVYVALAGWALAIPYFFYVVRFLDPSNIIVRLRDQTERTVERAYRGRLDPERAQDEVHQRLDQIGTIVLKSLDRADRGVAREGVWALKQLLDRYAARKPHMGDGWFKVDRADFVGFSAEALDMLNQDRTWFEMKALQQMTLAYQHALGKASDIVSSMSDALRVIAVHAAERKDDAALQLCIRFFNNFLREAIKSKNVHAVYDVFHQYRVLARDLADRDEVVRAISKHLVHYAGLARTAGLGFAPLLASYDVGYVVRRAYEAGSKVGPALLGDALSLPHRDGNQPLATAVKAKLILGGFFLERGKEAEAARVRENISDVPIEAIRDAEREILAADPSFFEVTDRQINLDYVPPERRDHVKAFVASLQP